jgi:uncharacterized protein (TIGR04222 family)
MEVSMDGPRADLWRRICAFQFDEPGATQTFAARLARENAWSVGYALRVVEEYRRFLFLAMVAGHEVTPSDEVDEAWHLHLVYTKSYWDDLCRNVLCRPLHHHPTRGGAAEGSRHRVQYEKTLASYRAHFGETPPADIWPPTDVRFGKDSKHVRVSPARSWIIPKPRLWPSSPRHSRWLLSTGFLPLVMGIADPLEMSGPEFLALYGILTAMVLVAAVALRQWLREDDPPVDTKELEPQEVACLGRGAAGLLQSCLAGLVGDRRIEIDETPSGKLGPISIGNAKFKLRASVSPDTAKTEIERAMLASAAAPTGSEAAEVLRAGKPFAEMIESRLQSRGYLETNASFGPARWWPILLVGGLVTFGLLKLAVGVSRDKPVGFLVVWLIALAVVMFLFARKPLRTRRGERIFNELKAKHEPLKTLSIVQPDAASAANLMLVAGLFGLAAIQTSEVRMLQTALKPVPGSDGGLAGSTGGCSGGGDGGGGGGCGGCGGGD